MTPLYADLVERLRNFADKNSIMSCTCSFAAEEATNAITTLLAENERARELLEILTEASGCGNDYPDDLKQAQLKALAFLSPPQKTET